MAITYNQLKLYVKFLNFYIICPDDEKFTHLSFGQDFPIYRLAVSGFYPQGQMALCV
jgi:hypothetical protein